MIGRLRNLALPAHLRALVSEHENTLRRLLRGGFDDLTLDERRTRAELVIRISARASVALAGAPIPFLELPVHAAMVGAIGKIYGKDMSGSKILLQLAASMGGGLAVRQLLRLIPVGGSLSMLARVHAATWALGKAAQLYFEQRSGEPGGFERGDFGHSGLERLPIEHRNIENGELQPVDSTGEHPLRRMFEDTLRKNQVTAQRHMGNINFESRLSELENLRKQGLITASEFRTKRGKLLDQL